MLAINEQLQLMENITHIGVPPDVKACSKDQLSPLFYLLSDPEPFSVAMEGIVDKLRYCQDVPYLEQGIPVVNFDPDKVGLGDLIRYMEDLSRNFISPVMDERNKVNAAKGLVHMGMKVTNRVAQLSEMSEGFHGIAFIMPKHISIVQGEHVPFDELVVKGSRVPLDIWRPPCSGEIYSQQSSSPRKRPNASKVTKYYFNVVHKPLGSERTKQIDVTYLQDEFIESI